MDGIVNPEYYKTFSPAPQLVMDNVMIKTFKKERKKREIDLLSCRDLILNLGHHLIVGVFSLLLLQPI